MTYGICQTNDFDTIPNNAVCPLYHILAVVFLTIGIPEGHANVGHQFFTRHVGNLVHFSHSDKCIGGAAVGIASLKRFIHTEWITQVINHGVCNRPGSASFISHNHQQACVALAGSDLGKYGRSICHLRHRRRIDKTATIQGVKTACQQFLHIIYLNFGRNEGLNALHGIPWTFHYLQAVCHRFSRMYWVIFLYKWARSGPTTLCL